MAQVQPLKKRRRREALTSRSQGFFVGRIYDKYGPRWLMLFGTFMHVFGLMMASVSTQYYQIVLSQGICSPIGICCLFTPGACRAPMRRLWTLTRA